MIGDSAGRRPYVPTIYGQGPEQDTIWVDSWEQFRAVGGVMCWSEDQTEIELTLPIRHKFSIQFMRQEVKPEAAECAHCGGDGIEPAGMSFDAGDGEGEDRPCSVCQ